MTLSIGEYIDSLWIPYEEIASATNNFADRNLITEASDSSVKVYKGQLFVSGQLTDIVAHKFQQRNSCLKELEISYILHQRNLTSVVALSDIEDLILIKKYEANGSLDKHLSGSTLTWLQRLHICLGVARALRCLHYDDFLYQNTYMIHGDIKSSKILLDDSWEPKLQGSNFALYAYKIGVNPTSKNTATVQFLDPAYETTGGLTLKSDVFSFGVVLFEVLFGRKAFISNDDNWYFARLARLHYEEERLDEMIDPDLRKQMDLQSLEFFSETAYFCLKEDRTERPDMYKIVKRLERALEFQKKHQSPEESTIVVEGTSYSHLKGKNLDHLRIPLHDIKLATENFSETYCVGSGGYGKVYKADLNHFNGGNLSETKGKSKDETFTRRSTVAIKRIFTREDMQGEEGFLAEIEMLSKCKHPNVISLLGFCDEGHEMILVYEYASNGSLVDHFGNNYKLTNLSWAQRVQICLDIAHGLKYLHTRTEDKQKIIHRDVKSANILLDDNWVVKIADFGLSKLHDMNQQGSTLMTSTIAGTEVYLDPEYRKSGKLKKASDIYSFGVVMFEILCGRLAYDNIYTEKGLPSVIRQRFNDGTLKEIIDPKIREADEIIFMLFRGTSEDSLDIFIKIAYQCLAETQVERPTIEVIIQELKKALDIEGHDSQTNLMENFSLEEIKLATRNFNDTNCIGEGRFWRLYKGEVVHTNANRCTTIVAKRWDSKSPQRHDQFFRELVTLLHEHENIIGLQGYCGEMDEKIIVYEHLSNGRLDKHLDNPTLTWMRRLKICIDIASGLDFLHKDVMHKISRIHRDIKSGNILLDTDWKAKLSNFELSSNSGSYEEIQHFTDNAHGSLHYIDPDYKQDFLRIESDIYSLGVVLLEILCGRLAGADACEDRSQSLGPLAKRHYVEEGSLDELVFKDIRGQIASESLTMFQMIALQCIEADWRNRPDASHVVEKLKIALECQEDHEIWKPKLPRDYEAIIQMTKSPEIYSDKTKKVLYNMLTKGILLQNGKVLFTLGTNGERNEMILARFSYKNHRSHSWQSILTSRFQKTAKMLDVSKLKTQIKIRTQFLSPGANYGVYLVFKFFNQRKVSATPMYVNLTYKMGNETLHSYFATWRDDEWLMIELSRFWTEKKEADFKTLLQSFSLYYCKSGAVYVKGIEFREISNMKHEQIQKSMAVQQESPTESKETTMIFQRYAKDEKLFSPSKVHQKKHHILSAKDALFHSSNMKTFILKPSADSRFEEVVEVLALQVLHIKCKIESQMLSPDTKYACYLLFKLSEKCRGLYCPVRVRDLLRWNNKETEILYFRSPSALNRHYFSRTPKTREDGWMEVSVWKNNSSSKFKNGCLTINLKLISYEGNMSGLIVYGLEFRPM